ncbi:endonuclease V [Haloferax mediterranei ATCC 33500]|uniref:Endonuclease V n=1 Tax=Haloferax mediterranei (strain ATCC 33500 / DSM 1411 / JCM 8866 / NBRC 14739 / NCIMB 2177 / R-4) TaxID=523841 RepID=I3R2E8_HALMT|nr:endonuclease V [Haloferax mediterranei]AFK18408.1 endonuclease V (deoxyinosine 3'endonuclease) [Haloferax mediterranei ATCC 33500]EMA02317.1 endonuclease V [Haloferax mediterranei ATCC 33500]MDX5988500.1 endonuclease V [Haloferax mediterranei ATCC 33500]QCQ74917.1 endonuclease V [Haloferax mediterranei ATCC 33500]
MRQAYPEFAPKSGLSRAEMESLQRRVAESAVFEDALPFDPANVSLGDPENETLTGDSDTPLVAGIDQSFLDDRALSAVVVLRGGEVVERVHAVTDLDLPYIPGLLSFREGGPILDALSELDTDPDLLVFDGSGRIHFRQAGLATHLGVICDVPSIGVAKSLLCGTPDEDLDGRPEGWRTPIRADDSVDAVGGHPATPETTIGYAFQSRQYDSRPIVNPLYVSPGHRVSAETAVDLISQLSGEYKLPEPTRLADAYADEAKAQYED